MDKLIKLTSVVAPVPGDDINTDIIFPARFLLLLDREGLGQHAFHEWRNAEEPFVLDSPEYCGASILACGHNFGIGSSREQAVWALHDLGIRCILAYSFGEIFQTNCIKNGVLPLILDVPSMQRIETMARNAKLIEVDLATLKLRLPDNSADITFNISESNRQALMSGQTDIDRMLIDDIDAIEQFESSQSFRSPWISISKERFTQLDTEPDAHE